MICRIERKRKYHFVQAKRVYEDGKLRSEATLKKYLTVQTEETRQVSCSLDHYNLQMIITGGFKVNNQCAVQFRKWAGQIVKDYIGKDHKEDYYDQGR